MMAVATKTKRKKRNKEELFAILDEYGVRSAEFYNYVEPFIINNIRKFTYGDVDQALVNDCYLSIVKAYNGYYKISGGEKIFVAPYFNKDKCKSPINFIITLCRNQVTLYNYHKNKQQLELEKSEVLDNFGDKNSSLDTNNYFTYTFNNFIFDNDFLRHLQEVVRLKPVDNIFYNFLKWEDLSNTEDFQQ